MRDHPLVTGRPETWMDGWGEDAFGPFAELRVKDVTQRFRWIPPGTFMMGSPPIEIGRRANEGPLHEVTLIDGCWLGETPVTQALWEAVMGYNPSHFKSSFRPVENVSWNDCQRFVRSLRDDRLRLPTEVEWERACRAATTTATWRGDFEENEGQVASLLGEIAWYVGNSDVGFEGANSSVGVGRVGESFRYLMKGTHDVGTRASNPWGIHDMLGNVWEWCEELYGDYETGLLGDPWMLRSSDFQRVIRGAAWDSKATHVRAACRSRRSPHLRFSYVGFRLVRGEVVAPSLHVANASISAESNDKGSPRDYRERVAKKPRR